jgi:hypothetical protein
VVKGAVKGVYTVKEKEEEKGGEKGGEEEVWDGGGRWGRVGWR